MILVPINMIKFGLSLLTFSSCKFEVFL